MTTKKAKKKRDIYKSITDLPVLRWFEILKTGELHHLYVKGKGPSTTQLALIWLDLQQQYFDEFGIDDNFLIKMQKMKRLVELRCEFIISGHRVLLNEINQIERDIKDAGEAHAGSCYKLADQIEKHRKYYIDLKVITVMKWGHMVKDYVETMSAMRSKKNAA